MKLHKNRDYMAKFPGGARKVQFLCFGAKGKVKVADPTGPGSAIKEIPRDCIVEAEVKA